MVISSHSPGTLVRRLVPPPHSQEQSDHPDLQFRISCDFQLRSRKTQRYLRYVLLATLAEGPVPLPLWVVGQSPQRQLTILHSLTLTGNSTKARTNHHEMIGLHQSNLVATLTKQNKAGDFQAKIVCPRAILCDSDLKNASNARIEPAPSEDLHLSKVNSPHSSVPLFAAKLSRGTWDMRCTLSTWGRYMDFLQTWIPKQCFGTWNSEKISEFHLQKRYLRPLLVSRIRGRTSHAQSSEPWLGPCTTSGTALRPYSRPCSQEDRTKKIFNACIFTYSKDCVWKPLETFENLVSVVCFPQLQQEPRFAPFIPLRP